MLHNLRLFVPLVIVTLLLFVLVPAGQARPTNPPEALRQLLQY